LLSSHR